MTTENGKPGGIPLNWPTIVLILVTGGGNFLETRLGNGFNAEEIQRATREIHDLYPKLEEAIQRQKQLQTTLNDIKDQTKSK